MFSTQQKRGVSDDLLATRRPRRQKNQKQTATTATARKHFRKTKCNRTVAQQTTLVTHGSFHFSQMRAVESNRPLFILKNKIKLLYSL